MDESFWGMENDEDRLHFSQGSIMICKSKQFKFELNMLIQDLMTKSMQEDELMFQNDRIWSILNKEGESEGHKPILGLKSAIHDDQPIWRMLTSLVYVLYCAN